MHNNHFINYLINIVGIGNEFVFQYFDKTSNVLEYVCTGVSVFLTLPLTLIIYFLIFCKWLERIVLDILGKNGSSYLGVTTLIPIPIDTVQNWMSSVFVHLCLPILVFESNGSLDSDTLLIDREECFSIWFHVWGTSIFSSICSVCIIYSIFNMSKLRGGVFIMSLILVEMKMWF